MRKKERKETQGVQTSKIPIQLAAAGIAGKTCYIPGCTSGKSETVCVRRVEAREKALCLYDHGKHRSFQVLKKRKCLWA